MAENMIQAGIAFSIKRLKNGITVRYTLGANLLLPVTKKFAVLTVCPDLNLSG